jgi:hypothetical protein
VSTAQLFINLGMPAGFSDKKKVTAHYAGYCSSLYSCEQSRSRPSSTGTGRLCELAVRVDRSEPDIKWAQGTKEELAAIWQGTWEFAK